MSTNNFNFTAKAHISISRVDHSTSIIKSIDDIFQKQLFTDVCLSCENQIINAHRLILAASASFFHSLFSQQPCCLNPNPVIVIRDMKINELKAILEFIYYGNVVVPESDLNSLIKSAESLGVYGLGKLKFNANSLNESKDQHEINNNNVNTKSSSTNSNKVKHQLKSNDLNRSNQTTNKSQQTDRHQSDRHFRRKEVHTKQHSDVEENDQEKKDLEEKRKKKELINQTAINQQQSQNTTPSPTSTPTTSPTANNQSTSQSQFSQQSASKRQSLRIRYRKNNSESTKEANAFDLLNTSNNSELSLSELASNGKRLRRTDSDLEDDLMSVDGSEYFLKDHMQKEDNHQEDEDTPTTNTNTNKMSLLVNKIAIRDKTLKLKRNKNSILKKQNDDSTKKIKLMLNKADQDQLNSVVSRRQLDELGLKTNEVLTEANLDLLCEESIVLKKLDSASSSSLSTSRKNSVDSNNDNAELLMMKLNKNDKQELNESTSAGNNQSLLAKQQSQQQNQKKKRRKISVDNT